MQEKLNTVDLDTRRLAVGCYEFRLGTMDQGVMCRTEN